MNVLVACEFSGIVREAFAWEGFNAWSVDLLRSERPGQHYRGSIFDMSHYFGEHWRWDLMIAHPPCTYLCNSGVRWLHETPGRWGQMREGAEFFKRLERGDMEYYIPHRAIENPIMHGYARDIIGRGPDQYIQPWQFGHGETKKTGFHLVNLPLLKPTNIVEGRENRVHGASPGKDRWKVRSRFYEGIAEAMAKQWGDFIRTEKLQNSQNNP